MDVTTLKELVAGHDAAVGALRQSIDYVHPKDCEECKAFALLRDCRTALQETVCDEEDCTHCVRADALLVRLQG